MDTVSTKTLEETPARAVLFLKAIATRVEVRAAMFNAGYTEEEQSHGWELVMRASGYAAPERSTSNDERARQAIAEIDAWDEPGFRRIHAALERLHPEQDQFVFNGIEAVRGAGAVVSVAKLLDRLDKLETSAERKSMKAADKAALSTLEARGFTRAERKRLRELVEIAKLAAEPVLAEPLPPEHRVQLLGELRAWYKDWSETARALIHRRDHLILMGLAHRTRSEKNAEEEPATAPVAAAAV